MEPGGRSRQLTIVPKLYYDNAHAAIDWLERALGFKTRLVVPGEDGAIVHAELSLDDGVIMIGTSRPDQRCVSPRQLNGVTHVLCIRVVDPSVQYERAIATGANISQPLAKQPHEDLGFTVVDPEGNQWHVGTYAPGEHWTT